MTALLSVQLAFADTEPNNSIALAEVVAFGSVSGTVEATLDNLDYYRTTNPLDGNVTVSVTFSGSATGRIYFYNADGTNLGVSTTGNVTSRVHNCINAGTVYFAVERITGAGPVSYTATISVGPSIYANDVEPNSTIGQAFQVLSPGITYTGHVGYANGSASPSDGFDYYRAILPNDGEVTVSGLSDNGLSYRFYIYNSAGTNLSTGSASTTPSNTVDCMAGGDTIYIAAQEVSGCGGYSFSYTIAPSAYANDLEPNNSIGTTAAVLSPDVLYQGHLAYSNLPNFPTDAIDYYRAILPEDGNVTVSGVSDNGLSYRFYIYNSAGTNLSTGSASTTPTNTVNCMAGGDTIYISAQQVSGCGGYQFSYSISAVPQPNDAEPNNSTASALPIAPNFPVEGHLGYTNTGGVFPSDGTDYYVFSGQGAGLVTFNATIAGSLTARLRLRNSVGSTLITGTATAAPTLAYTLAADGTYYLEIEQTAGCGGYTLSFDNGCDLTSLANEQVISVGAQLQWNTVSGAGSYNVRRGPAGGPFEVITTSARKSIWYPLVENTDYEWQVQSICGARVSGYIPLRPFTTLEFPVCPAVSGLTQSGLTSTGITLTWNPSIYAIGYRVEYRIAGNLTGSAVNTAANTVTLSGLSPATNYEFRVVASCYGDGTSPYRNGTFSTPAARVALEQPAWTIWPVPTTGNLNFTWNSAQAGALGIEVLDLSGRQVRMFQQSIVSGANSHTLNLDGVQPGMYHLRIVDPAGNQWVKPFGIQ